MGIFKAYDVRGVYGENLTSREAFLLGYYLARYLNLNSFKVAHDLMNSHEDLTKSDALFSSVSLTSSVKYFPWRIFLTALRPISPSAFSTALPCGSNTSFLSVTNTSNFNLFFFKFYSFRYS